VGPVGGDEQLVCGRGPAFCRNLHHVDASRDVRASGPSRSVPIPILALRLARQLCTLALLILVWAATAVSHAQTSPTVRAQLGDFNGDGRSDLLFQRSSDGSLFLYQLNGFQASPAQAVKQLGADWTLDAVADLNNDGTDDMLFRRGSDGMLAGYLMNGPQVLAAAMIGGIGTDWNLAGAADFNGDGRADLLFRRKSDGLVSLVLMSGLQVQSAQFLGTIGVEWELAALGDFNADGRADMVFRRKSDGMV
jgi:FG-GAP-like repeat